ncbi:MAG: response regulator [Planctomycetes bacterium]|nr:response regulator [Planctomycetota bacterium]
MSAEVILVIDDEQDVAEAVRRILSKLGYHVETSYSSEDALERLEREHFDVVISDLIMPGGISARDIYEWIKAHVPKLARRVILMTGATAGDRAEKLLSGIELPVIWKPFSVEELRNTVAGVMAHA